ncbi:MAG: porin, partial [Gammaproteobacteria bacterium]
GRGVVNNDQNMMWMGRLQWNFLGRDLDWKQTDVEYTELPTGSLAFAAATNEGRCTRWSSGGCGNLDGYRSPAAAMDAQYAIDQMVQEFAFKWRGFSVQQEFHWKTIDDLQSGMETNMVGAYAQAGYFFHHWIPAVPAPLELAFRYAFVSEPNRFDLALDNLREEFTIGANWFFAGHNNKFTLDYSHLSLEDAFLARDVSDDRVRFQWDISF